MTIRFIKNYDIFKEDKRLKPSHILTLSKLYDRLNLSKKNGYFSSKFKEYYVLYSQKEMAKELNVSARTVFSIYKFLVKCGYMITKQQRNSSALIFLPKSKEVFSDSTKTVKNNQSTAIASDDNVKAEAHKGSKITNEKNNVKSTSQVDFSECEEDPIKLWESSVMSKAKLPKSVVNSVVMYAHGDLNKCEELIGQLYIAKHSVVESNGLVDDDPKTRFESNGNMSLLPITVQRVLHKMKYKFSQKALEQKQDAKYFMVSMKNFFEEAMGIKKPMKTKTPDMTDNHGSKYMPRKQRGSINRKLPEWMKKEYKPELDQVSVRKYIDYHLALSSLKVSGIVDDDFLEKTLKKAREMNDKYIKTNKFNNKPYTDDQRLEAKNAISKLEAKLANTKPNDLS